MRYPAALVFLTVFALSCVRPSTVGQFVEQKNAVGGVYGFELFMPDTMLRYDVSFFFRVDPPFYRAGGKSRLEMYTEWVSPSDSVFLRDTVWMDYDVVRGGLALYRSGVELSPNWKLKVRIPQTPRGFGGLGVICKENGTR